MSFRDILRKLIPIGRKEAREQYKLFNQKIEELQRQLKVQRQWQEAALQDQQDLLEKILLTVREFCESKDTENLAIQTSQQEILLCLQDQAGMMEQADQKLQEIIEGDIFRRIEFLQTRMVYLEHLIQSNMLDIKQQQNSSTYQFILRMRELFPLMIVDSPKGFVRMGRKNDGGYVMLDDFENREIAYSIGIADDVSWDTAMTERGIEVYMYDHTIDGIQDGNERFHFFRTGLCAEGAQTDCLKSLPELMQDNGHSEQYGMILKIDIEGAEWDVLCSLDEEILKHFSQIVFEFHGLIFPENEEKIRLAMSHLNLTHQLVHIHGNNFGSYIQLGGAILPELIEGTYLLREEYQFIPSGKDFRWKPDSANNCYLPDIFLGSWNV